MLGVATVHSAAGSFTVPLPAGAQDEQFDKILEGLEDQGFPDLRDASIEIPLDDGTSETRSVKQIRRDQALRD